MALIRSLTLTAATVVVIAYSFIVYKSTNFSKIDYAASTELYKFPDNFDKSAFVANVEKRLEQQKKQHLMSGGNDVEKRHYDTPIDEAIETDISQMTDDPVDFYDSPVSIEEAISQANQEIVTASDENLQLETPSDIVTEETAKEVDDNTEDKKEVDFAWLAKREHLLKANGPRKLFLFAYMHGGSTLLFKLFDQDPRTFAWYESLAPLYGHMYGLPSYRTHTWIIKNTSKVHEGRYYPRTISDYETKQIRLLLRGMFMCNFDDIPKEVFTSSFLLYSSAFKNFTRCYTRRRQQPNALWETHCADRILSPMCGQYGSATHPPFVEYAMKAKCHQRLKLVRGMLTVQDNPVFDDKELQVFINHQKCVNNLFSAARTCIEEENLLKQCKSSVLRTTKILRLKMMSMEPMIKAIPDIRVVYYTRDPRATISSRHGNKQNNMKNWKSSITKLCSEMNYDMDALERLERKFPGAFLRLRYEDLVESPDEAVQELFKHVDLDPTERSFDWIHSALHSELNEGQQRKNASFTASKWKQNYPQESIEEVTNVPECFALLRRLGYE